jgi:uncharacterized membrane protein YjjB (DUF3815 family)
MDWTIFEKVIWYGVAAMGFSILFNVPTRTLLFVFLIGALGGLTRLLLLKSGMNIIVASMVGAMLIGLISIPFAHVKHAPPLVFSIPAVIPMVPGIFAYRTMLGLIKLAGEVDPATYPQVLSETINNGLKAMFILMSLAGGVAVPMLITRKESVKHMRLIKRMS